MPMIPRADAQALAREAVVLDLGDLARQGEALIEHARQEADRIVQEAKAERDRLIAGAEERGYEQGLRRGYDEGVENGTREGLEKAILAERESIESMVGAWTKALEQFEGVRDELEAQSRRGVLELAVRFSERVAKRAIELDADAAVAQLAEAIDLAMRPSRLRIRVSPEAVEGVRSAMPGFVELLDASASVAIEGDASLSHGSVVVETDTTRIDATIETQLARLVDALLPGGPG